ncbi:MAG: PKD domain-containing protein, partial [Thermoplasmata archaeon]
LTYEWDFDDGNSATGNITYHSFNQKGTYNVKLTVNDSQLQNFTYVTVIVDNYPPYVDLTASTTSVYVNQTITFYGYNSSDAETQILKFFWDYDNRTDTNGDGNYTNDIDNETNTPTENTTHSYDTPGTYVVTLAVWDGTINSTDTVGVTILANVEPTASIDDPSPFSTFSVNETIFFNGTGSSDPNDVDLEYFWYFGDGDDSGWMTQPTTFHHYSSSAFPFNYFVTLTVRDDEGQEDSTTITIIIENYPPVAVASSNVTSSLTYQDITFDGSGSYDDDGTVSSYEWDFDDGDTSSDQITEHQFAEDGEYNVTLTVLDEDGANHTDWIIITITNRNPDILNVTTTPEFPKINEPVDFKVIASDDGQIVKYEWNFGDGTGYQNFTLEEGNTTYTYDSIDEYIATLRITDDDGAISTTDITIRVVNTPPEVVIDSPKEDDPPVAGIVTIRGTASDTDGSVDRVEVRIDSGNWLLAEDDSSDNSWSEWSYEWNTEDGVPNGEHTIYVRANDGESYTEPPASVLVNVSNIPSSISLTSNLNPTSVEAGGTVQVQGNVTYNTGEDVENAEVNVTIIGEDGFWLTTTDSSGLYSTDITAPIDADTYTVRIRAIKGSLSPVQTTELLTVMAPPAKPDLSVVTSDIFFDPSDPFSGDTVQIRITVRNIGNEDASNVLVNVYDGDPDAGGDNIGSDTQSIPKSGNRDVFVSWDTTGLSGLHFIYVVLDPGNSIDESDENNNKASNTITVSGKPDFAIDSEDISLPGGSPKVGDEISIGITIHNDGTDSGRVTYEVYDGDPSVGFRIGTGEENILSGKEKTVFVVWTPDEGGDHDIHVVLDPDDDVDEADEDNNEASKIISVESKPGDGGVP